MADNDCNHDRLNMDGVCACGWSVAYGSPQPSSPRQEAAGEKPTEHHYGCYCNDCHSRRYLQEQAAHPSRTDAGSQPDYCTTDETAQFLDCEDAPSPQPEDGLEQQAREFMRTYLTFGEMRSDGERDLSCEVFGDAAAAFARFLLSAERERVRPYLQHKSNCRYGEHECSQPECGETHIKPCSCGLHNTLGATNV